MMMMAKMQFTMMLLVAALIHSHSTLAQEMCTLCPDKSALAEPMKMKPFTIPGFEAFVKTCGDVEGLAPTVLTLDNELCTVIHSLSSFCGCPSAVELSGHEACGLCGKDDAEVVERVAPENLGIETDYPDMVDPRIPAQCGLVEAMLWSNYVAGSSECVQGKQYAAECGCQNVDDPPDVVVVDPPPPEEPEEPEDPPQPCAVCQDGGDIAFPEKDVSSALEQAGMLQQLLDLGLSPNCATVNGLVSTTLIDGTLECRDSQVFLGGLCGCKSIEGSCDFCPNDETMPYPDTLLYPVEAQEGFLPTCSDMGLTLTQIKESSELCFGARHFNFLCGCNGGERHYMGADTEFKRAFLAWLPRTTGFMSFIGSLLIIYDILKDGKKRVAVYNQLVLAMSLFDLLSSAVWIVSTAAIPEHQDGAPTGIYGAIGNDATCTSQGFFMQLGMIGSTAYNLMLSVYYVFVIVKSYRETQLKGLRKWLHIPCILLSLSLAFAGLPLYENIVTLCHIAPPPLASSRKNIAIFVIAPISIFLGGAFFNMGWVYFAVSKQNRAANRWRIGQVAARGNVASPSSTGPAEDDTESSDGPVRQSMFGRLSLASYRSSYQAPVPSRGAAGNGPMGAGGGRQLDRVVLWQAVFYLAAFILTWPFYYISVLNPTCEEYYFWVLVYFFSPLQGLFNWIVYMRPRWGSTWVKRMNRRSRLKTASKNETHQTDEDDTSRHFSGQDASAHLVADREPPNSSFRMSIKSSGMDFDGTNRTDDDRHINVIMEEDEEEDEGETTPSTKKEEEEEEENTVPEGERRTETTHSILERAGGEAKQLEDAPFHSTPQYQQWSA